MKAETVETPTHDIESQLKNYSKLSPVEKIELATRIRGEATKELKVKRDEIEGELKRLQKILGEDETMPAVRGTKTPRSKAVKRTTRRSKGGIPEKITAA